MEPFTTPARMWLTQQVPELHNECDDARFEQLVSQLAEMLRTVGEATRAVNVPRWRSMDSAPGDGQPALFAWPDGTRMIGWLYADGSIAGQQGGYLPRGAIAWQPLPDPPTGEVEP